MSVDIKTIAIKDLSGEITVSLAAVAATTLYTVPAGFTAVIDHVDIIVGADAGASTLTIGRSTALTDFLNTQTITALNAANAKGELRPVPSATVPKQVTYAAGVVIQADVTAANGGATNYVHLFGYLIAD